MNNVIILTYTVLLLFALGCRNQDSSRASVNHLAIESIRTVNEWVPKYEFTENMKLIVDGRIFILEDLPKSAPEEIVVRDFLYSITAEFDKKYDILANIEPHVINIENERNWFEGGVFSEESFFVQNYIIHRITTLTNDQYDQEKTASGEINPLFYWGWQQRIAEYDLNEYEIINVDFTVVFSNGYFGNLTDGTYNRSYIVGKSQDDITYRIYDFGIM